METDPHHALTALAAGDHSAWAALVAAVAPRCRAVAQAVLGCSGLADDAVQDCLIELRRSARRYRPGQPGAAAALAWVVGIQVRVARQLGRREARLRRRHERQEAVMPRRTVEDPPADAGLQQAVNQALISLSDRHRRPLELRFLAGLAYDEVARQLGIAEAAARQRVHRAMVVLRQRLERDGRFASGAAIAAVLDAHLIPPPLPPWSSIEAWSQLSTPVGTAAVLSPGVLAMIILFPTCVLAAVAVLANDREAAIQPPAAQVAPAAEVAAEELLMVGEDGLLGWLARTAQDDGSWPAATEAGRLEATALAVLALAAAGDRADEPGPRQACLQHGQAWLARHLPDHLSRAQAEGGPLLPLIFGELALQESGWSGPAAAVRQRLRVLVGQAVSGGWPALMSGHSSDVADLRATAAMALLHRSLRFRDADDGMADDLNLRWTATLTEAQAGLSLIPPKDAGETGWWLCLMAMRAVIPDTAASIDHRSRLIAGLGTVSVRSYLDDGSRRPLIAALDRWAAAQAITSPRDRLVAGSAAERLEQAWQRDWPRQARPDQAADMAAWTLAGLSVVPRPVQPASDTKDAHAAPESF